MTRRLATGQAIKLGAGFLVATALFATVGCGESKGGRNNSIDYACKNSDSTRLLASAGLLNAAQSTRATLTLRMARCDRDLISEFDLRIRGGTVTDFTAAASMNSPTFEAGMRDQPGYVIQDQVNTETFGRLYREVQVSSVSADGNVGGTVKLFAT
ncbi:hypothetical protein TTY48_19700 [Tsukamurella sp. TY48]|nr:hypothetical protein TTY48_19700 [Tsukamurella sp. TY48]